MPENLLVQLAVVFIPAIVLWLGYRLVLLLRRKRTNVELWATVFEGLMQKTVNLDPVKEPEIFIEKKAKKDGQDDEQQADILSEQKK
ncbi:MAG: hypothetical protein AB8B86_01675 [Pseudomonadales bacterium]